METGDVSASPVSLVDDNRKNIKKNVSFNTQSNILYFNKEQSSSFLEGMEADHISTFSDSPVKSSENNNSNNISVMLCNAESNTSFVVDVDRKESELFAVEKPCMPLKNLVIKLEKLPLNILNEFGGNNPVFDQEFKNVHLKKRKADLSPNSVQKKTRCTKQNRDINKFNGENYVSDEESKNVLLKNPKASPNSVQKKTECINQERYIYTKILKSDKNSIQTNASDSLLTKDNTFKELKVSLKPLPDNLLMLDENVIILQNSEQFISSVSVKSTKNQCSDQRNLKKPRHKVSKSKLKKLKPVNSLLKISKQNAKYLANEGRCNSSIPLDSVSINLRDIGIPKSPDYNQYDEVCTENEKLNRSFDVDPLSLVFTSTSAMSNIPSKNAKTVENSESITSTCASNSVRLSLLQASVKEIASDTDISSQSNILTDSVAKKINNVQNQNLLAKENSNYPISCNISFKKPVVVLEKLNLVLPEEKCEGMSIQTIKEGNLQMGDNSHLQTTSSIAQKARKKKAKLKSNLQKRLKISGSEDKKKVASSKFGSTDFSINNLCEDDLPLSLFADNHLKEKYSISKKMMKNKSKSFEKAKKLSKFNLKKLSIDTTCEEDVPLLLFSKNNDKKKQNYFTSKKKIKNKYKSLKKAKNFSKFVSKDLFWDSLPKFNSKNASVGNFCEDLPLLSFAKNNPVEKKYLALKKIIKNKPKSSKKAKKVSKFDLNMDTVCEDDVPLLLFANNKHKKKKNFASKKKINKSSDRNPTSSLKVVSMDHSYFCPISSMNATLNSDLSISSPLANIKMDHNYVSGDFNAVQSLEMPTNHINMSSKMSKKSKKENSEKKTECPNCQKMDNPHIFLKTYLNKFCTSFDDLGKKKKSLSNVDQKKQPERDIQTARRNQEYGYDYIINKLHTHLKETCPLKESYKKQCYQNVNSKSFDTSEKNIAETAEIQGSPANESCTSLLHNETADEENIYVLSEMLFAAKRSSNGQHRSKSHIDKYRLGFLAANNPLRLYNKCLASERFLLSKYEMTNDQRKKLKKMFCAMKNNAAAIEKIE